MGKFSLIPLVLSALLAGPHGLVLLGAALAGGCGDDGSPTPAADAAPGADAPPVAPAAAVFTPPAPGAGASWGVVPYPSDLYLDSTGHLKLLSLPVGPLSVAADEVKLTETLATLDGAGVWSNVYLPVDGEVNPATLAGNVKLVDLDDDLRELPVDLLWRSDLDAIVIAPVWGTMLLENHRYAAYATTSVQGTDGTPLARAAAFAAATDLATAPADAAVAAAQTSLRPLVEALAAGGGPSAAELATATVFRTENVTRDARAMRDLVVATPPPIVSIDRVFSTTEELDALFGAQTADAVPGIDDFAPRGQPHSHVGAVVHGTLTLANFINAAPNLAGWSDYDGQGKPIIKGQHAVKFTLTLPAQASWANLPVIVYVHGLNQTRQDMLVQADTAGRMGMAVLAVDIIYHGSRARMPKDNRNDITDVLVPDGFGDKVGLFPAVDFFDLVASGGLPKEHMRAMRENLRQAAIDVCALASLVEDGDLTLLTAALAGVAGLPDDLSLRNGLALVSESFGSMIGAVVVAIEPRIHTAVLSVAAVGFPYPAVLHSPNYSAMFSNVVLTPFDVGARVLLGDPVKGARYDPLVNLYNAALEQGEPSAYAPYVRSAEHRGGQPANVLMTMVYADEWVPNNGTEHLASVIGASHVPMDLTSVPADGRLRFVDLPQAVAPFAGNVDTTHTAALVVYHPSTHGVVRVFNSESSFASAEPPFPLRAAPLPIVNPIGRFHAQWGQFVEEAFAGAGAPTVIDPYLP